MPPTENENRGGASARSGLVDSLHAAASNAAARIFGRALGVISRAGAGSWSAPQTQNGRTDTTFVSEPEAPWLSVTVTVTVKLCGSTTTEVCVAVNDPCVVRLPVVCESSPQ